MYGYSQFFLKNARSIHHSLLIVMKDTVDNALLLCTCKLGKLFKNHTMAHVLDFEEIIILY